MALRFLAIAFVAASLAGCASYSYSNVDQQEPDKPNAVAAKHAPTDPAKIILTKQDITDRKYEVIQDIEVTVNKTTVFHPDPTPALVDEKLRADAAKLGADAVVLVSYGEVGVSLLSWGSLDGKGRAVKFVE